MKEFIDKLIERLEEKQKIETSFKRDYFSAGVLHGYKDAISTINKLAEEYKDKVMIDGQYCWQTCSATEHCKECNRLCNGSIDYYENYDFMAEEYKGGWIADRVPTKEECGRYGSKEFQVTIPQSNGNKTVAMDYCYETVRGKEVGRWRWSGKLSPWDVLAWKPMDAPYTKGEKA